MSSTFNLLVALSLCGLMGVIGQGTRAIIGLSASKALASTNANQQSTFNSAYLVVSLIIGFIAGVLAGLALRIPSSGAAPSPDALLGLIAAGYAGTDFIENTFAKLLPSVDTSSSGSEAQGASMSAQTATNSKLQSVADNLHTISLQLASVTTPATTWAPATPVSPPFDLAVALSVALPKVLPRLNATRWVPNLTDAFGKYGLNNPLRVAAAMGRFVAEVGESFSELRENMSYSASGMLQMFPNEIRDQATANRLAYDPEAIANTVYANRDGNGSPESGDGFRFRGGGLCQLTGRAAYTQFAAAVGMSVEDAADYVSTPEGAAVSGCWYLKTNGCLTLADQWNLNKITRIVNGGGMEGLATRVDYANRFRAASGAFT